MWVIRGSLILLMGCLFGNELVVDSPKEITPQWEEKVFGIKYGVTTLDKAVHEMVDGLIDSYFGKDFFDRVKAYIEKQPLGDGEYIEYWENGNIKARLPFKDGKAHGHLHGWFKDGEDAFKGFFKEGVKQGIHITFYYLDKKKYTVKARLLTYNETGQLDGEQNTNHHTGNLWIALEYEDGKAEGPLEGWDLDHKYFLSALYKKGTLQKKPPLPPGKRPRPKSRIDIGYVNEVTNEFIEKASKKYGIKVYGSGGSMPFDVLNIEVYFSVKKRGTIKEARELIINLKEMFVQIINDHEKLRPYLRIYPFTIDRAEVILSFCDKNGFQYKDRSPCFVLLGKGKKIYYMCLNKLGNKHENLYEEPYEEAVKIVREQERALAATKK